MRRFQNVDWKCCSGCHSEGSEPVVHTRDCDYWYQQQQWDALHSDRARERVAPSRAGRRRTIDEVLQSNSLPLTMAMTDEEYQEFRRVHGRSPTLQDLQQGSSPARAASAGPISVSSVSEDDTDILADAIALSLLDVTAVERLTPAQTTQEVTEQIRLAKEEAARRSRSTFPIVPPKASVVTSPEAEHPPANESTREEEV